MGLKTLDEIAISFQTDKATAFTRTYARPKGFTVHYDKLFYPIRNEKLKVLEIGVAGGESIQMWLEYFPNSQVCGVDIVQSTNPWNTPGSSPDPRYWFVHNDQTDVTGWACFLADNGKDWDIVIDDGSHCNDGILTSFASLWPALKPGGFYAVEDLGAGYTPGSVHLKPGFKTHHQWLCEEIESMHNNTSSSQSIYFANELAIFVKRA